MREKVLDAAQILRLHLEVARVRRRRLAARVLRGLGPRLAKGGEAIETRIIHPDPHRKSVRREILRALCPEVRHLLARDLERKLHSQIAERTIRPRTRRDHQLPARKGFVRRLDRHLVATRRDVRDRRVVDERRAIRARHLLVRGVRAGGHRDPAVLLEEPLDVIAQRELRPPLHDLIRIEILVLHVARAHRAAIRIERNLRVALSEVESARLEHHLVAALALERIPRIVGELRELDVRHVVIREPDDP